LSQRVKGLKTRVEVQDYLGSCQMVLGTVASLVGSQREQLMGLFAFDVVIIDEASQLLDAMVLPLLMAVPKWIMVGDHRQLSAVVAQPAADSAVQTKELRALGFSNWRLSLFERLYLRAEREGWTHAYTLLRYQGRMHADIGGRASGLFYADQLECLPETTARGLEQRAPLQRNPAHFPPTTPLQTRLMTERMVFVPVPAGLTAAERGTQSKTSLWEAQQVAALAVWYVRGMLEAGVFNANKSLGIIAPFRNQVALIKQWLTHYAALEEGEAILQAVDALTVDTVERYQGSQRDVILVSFAVQQAFQLGLITALSDTEPNLCRKLNVAITRAREQLVMFGDAEVLRLEPAYAGVVVGVLTS
jgi:DNA replication ATP-dependent helicase Dna2